MKNSSRALALSALFVVLLTSAPAHAQQTMKQALDMCEDEDAQTTIVGCTWMIESREELTPISTVHTHLRRAVAYSQVGEHAKAVDDYSVVIRLAPGEGRFYQYRGVSRANNGQHSKAIKDYSKALRTEPDNAEALYNRGFSYGRLEKYEKAIADYDRAIALKPDFHSALNNRGHSWMILDECEKAMPDFEAALKVKPDHALTYANRAECRFELGDYKGAVADHEKSVQLQPENADLFNSSCWTRNLVGDGSGALKDCNRAIELASDVPAFYDSRALAYYQLARYEEALVDSDHSMTEATWENHILRAAIHYRLGNLDAAEADYKKARRMQRDKEELAERLELLEVSAQDLDG